MIAVDGSCTIDATNYPQRLSPVSMPVTRADIIADAANGNTVYIGGENVSSYASHLVGTPLATSDIKTIENADLYDWWISGTAGDRVYWGGEYE